MDLIAVELYTQHWCGCQTIHPFLEPERGCVVDWVVCGMVFAAGFDRQAVPLTVYAVQLLLNFLWTPLFFKAHALGLASLNILGG